MTVQTELTSIVAMETTLWTEGIKRSMLLYLSTSDTASLSSFSSSGSIGGRASAVTNSPRSGGTVDTVAHASAEMIEQIYSASENYVR